MRPNAYVGVTGFMTCGEIEDAIAVADRELTPCGPSGRQLMIGILVSEKTLRGERNKHPGRYPVVDASRLQTLLEVEGDALRLIHYATDRPESIVPDLRRMVTMVGRDEILDGFQLNCTWPDVSFVGSVSMRRMVLQIGPRALERAGSNPSAVAARVAEYGSAITDILFDASCGTGTSFDAAQANRYLEAIADRCPNIGLGVAGGLSGGTLAPATWTLARFPDASIDAEGLLRDANDKLDADKVRIYLTCAAHVIEKMSREPELP